MPCKPSVGESCSGEGSSAYMQKQDSRELPAPIVMFLTSLLSQGHEWILLHKIYLEGVLFCFSVHFVSLDLEVWRSQISKQVQKSIPRVQGLLPGRRYDPVHRVQLPRAERPTGMLKAGLCSRIPSTHSFIFRYLIGQAKVWPTSGDISLAFPVGVQGCSTNQTPWLTEPKGWPHKSSYA